ncbi:postacrosomal sheath WW domain-binding protein-like isoform X3 [Bolinopsis microptera]|uniref:postacrosomal sheath WW domain-binding protein-like isoform X3 n=1 Tax=Bolinopsis microptera TaxID=2820187 RepID=UPI00307AB1C6
MSVNTASNGPGRLLLMPGERVVSRTKSVEFHLDGNNLPPKLVKSAAGEIYLTNRRVIFLSKDSKNLHSFSADFGSISNVELEQPLFGANNVKSIVRAEPGGGWDGTAKLKLIFSSGGAIQFGKHLRHMQQGGAAPTELPPTYDSFDYNPYGAPPAPYNENGNAPPYGYAPQPGPGYAQPGPGYAQPGPGYAPQPGPGYAVPPGAYPPPPPPPGYDSSAPPPSNYTAPPSYMYDAGPSTAAPPYNPTYGAPGPSYNAAAGQAMYADNSNTVYVNNPNSQPSSSSSQASAPPGPSEDKKTR